MSSLIWVIHCSFEQVLTRLFPQCWQYLIAVSSICLSLPQILQVISITTHLLSTKFYHRGKYKANIYILRETFRFLLSSYKNLIGGNVFVLKRRLKNLRCPICGKLLLKYHFKCSLMDLQIKCPKCGALAVLDENSNLKVYKEENESGK